MHQKPLAYQENTHDGPLVERMSRCRAIEEARHVVRKELIGLSATETINFHIKMLGVNQAALIAICDPLLGRRTVQRILKGENCEDRSLIILCNALQLPEEFALDLAGKMERSFAHRPELRLLISAQAPLADVEKALTDFGAILH